ncbi:MAG: hypothetical protein MUE94_13460 [Verrucomicrobia bacterium]|nr:hypothetical protein [Verrucomicrobiota bacterium]
MDEIDTQITFVQLQSQRCSFPCIAEQRKVSKPASNQSSAGSGHDVLPGRDVMPTAAAPGTDCDQVNP